MEQHSIPVVMKRLQRLTLRQGMGSGTTKAPTSKLKALALKAKRVRCCSGDCSRGLSWSRYPAEHGPHLQQAQATCLNNKRARCLLLWDSIC